MSDPMFESVRVTFDPYSHWEVQRFLKSVKREFGSDRSRWYWRTDVEQSLDHRWSLLFYFRNPHDATMFGLKYSR
jgi:hypothetical protein